MSSSAALEVSMLGALVQALGLKIDKQNLLSLANKVEKDILELKVGILISMLPFTQKRFAHIN